jgi:hypothetical protein
MGRPRSTGTAPAPPNADEALATGGLRDMCRRLMATDPPNMYAAEIAEIARLRDSRRSPIAALDAIEQHFANHSMLAGFVAAQKRRAANAPGNRPEHDEVVA